MVVLMVVEHVGQTSIHKTWKFEVPQVQPRSRLAQWRLEPAAVVLVCTAAERPSCQEPPVRPTAARWDPEPAAVVLVRTAAERPSRQEPPVRPTAARWGPELAAVKVSHSWTVAALPLMWTELLHDLIQTQESHAVTGKTTQCSFNFRHAAYFFVVCSVGTR